MTAANYILIDIEGLERENGESLHKAMSYSKVRSRGTVKKKLPNLHKDCFAQL